jgi:hypothetical protein
VSLSKLKQLAKGYVLRGQGHFAIITTHGNEILADFNDNYNDEEDHICP